MFASRREARGCASATVGGLPVAMRRDQGPHRRLDGDRRRRTVVGWVIPSPGVSVETLGDGSRFKSRESGSFILDHEHNGD